jgi:outer membrane receptor for ferrienterochelin and colicin
MTDWNVRASFTEPLSRPKYSALIPNVSYTGADEEATIGNPHLKATTAYNFDLSTDYYFKSVGMVSLGVFYKRLNNVVVSEVWKATDRPQHPSRGCSMRRLRGTQIPDYLAHQCLTTPPLRRGGGL